MFDQINVFQNIKKYTHPKPLNNVFQAQQPMTAMKYSMRSFYYYITYYIIINLRKKEECCDKQMIT